MTKIVKSVACPICGCLCDDLELTVENNQIVKMKNGCSVCEAKMVNGYNDKHERYLTPLWRQDGKFVPITYEEAIHKAAKILTDAKHPMIFGFSTASAECQHKGVELAEELGAALDNICTICHGPSVMAMQGVGIPTATLGQIRHRADLIIYWASNPMDSHPRHLERYTEFPEGRFEKSEWRRFVSKMNACSTQKKMEAVISHENIKKNLPCFPEVTDKVSQPPESLQKTGRKMVVIDVRETMTAKMADYFVQVKPNKDYEVMEALRAIVADQELEVDSVGGVPVEYLKEIADLMVGCKFGVIFFGLGLASTLGKFRNIEIAVSLTRDLNRRTKFVIMPMRGHYNVTGANVVFAWQTGYPYAIDFARGYAEYNPGEFSAIDLLRRNEIDATVVIAADPGAHIPKPSMQSMIKHPLIVIDPHMGCTALMGDLLIPTQWAGIECEGSAYRMDHVPVTLSKVVEPPPGIRNDVQILQAIMDEVRAIKAKNPANPESKPTQHKKEA
jgi:formylmethanofuran dehydrogenase subunit B